MEIYKLDNDLIYQRSDSYQIVYEFEFFLAIQYHIMENILKEQFISEDVRKGLFT